MKIRTLLFPIERRSFTGRRWANIVLRTLHLIGSAGVGGGYLYGAPKEAWLPYLALTIVSGFGLVLLEIFTSAIWLIQLCGIAILIKVGLLMCVKCTGGYEAYLLVFSIVISGITSHAPAGIRHFSIFHGRVVETGDQL